MKYYRFVSKDEMLTIFSKIKHDMFIESYNHPVVHLLKEDTITAIVPDAQEKDYNMDISEFFSENYKKTTVHKENFFKILAGVPSDYALLELELESIPSMTNLGWYGYSDKEKLEQVVLEYCVGSYKPSDVKAVYKGDFANWSHSSDAVKRIDLNPSGLNIRALSKDNLAQMKSLKQYYNYDCIDEDALEDDSDYYYGLFIEENLIGMASIGGADVLSNEKVTGLLLSDVLIHPDYRSIGIGTYFITELTNIALQQHEEQIHVQPDNQNLHNFYKECGFHESEEFSGGYPIFSKDLNLASLF